MTHTFTVTRAIDSPGADSDDPIYEIGGEHDDTCSVWYPCTEPGCDADDEGEFHGVLHLMLGGIDELCVLRADECGLSYAFEHDNPEFQMTELGVYDVEVEWDGDYWNAYLTLRKDSEGAR